MLEVECGDMRVVLATLPENSFDSCVCDPPYHLTQASRGGSPRNNDLNTPFGRTRLGGDRGFMGQTWDGGDVAFQPETWAHVFRVLKPGAHVVAFGGSRTWHRLACAIEDAGFELRESFAWLYSTGMPKSLNVQNAAMLRSGICLSKEPVRHVALSSSLIPVRSDGGKRDFVVASARILPEGAPALAMGIGRADVSSGLMVMSLSVLAEKTGSSTESLWNSISAEFSEQTKTCITRMNIERIIGSKILNSVLEALTSRSTIQDNEMNQHGCKCPVAFAVSFSTEGKLNLQPIPVRSVHDGVTSREQIERLEGVGSATKPCFEPVIVARKPTIGTLAENALAFGTGGLNIDACRDAEGRWAPNVCVDEDVAADLDETNGLHKSTPYKGGPKQKRGQIFDLEEIAPGGYSDAGGVSRYFYCPKAASGERDAGLEHWPVLSGAEATGSKDGQARLSNGRTGAGRGGGRRNGHPCVKPLALMRWLCRLVTPPAGFILDPFAGSGTTGCAAALEGFHFAGVELDPVHVRLATDRIAHWARSISVAGV